MSLRLFYLLLAAMCLNINWAAAQADSTILALKGSLHNLEGVEKVQAYTNLCWEYRSLDRDTAFWFGNKALELARSLNDSAGMAQAYNDMGYLYTVEANYPMASNYYERALALRLALRDTAGVGAVYGKMGTVYERLGDYDKAMEDWVRALDIFRKTGNKSYESYLLNNIAIIHQHQRNYDLALDFFQQSLIIKNDLNDFAEIAGTRINIANVYQFEGRTEEAIKEYRAAIKMAREHNATHYLSQALNNLGALLAKQNQHEEAAQLLEESLSIRQERNDRQGIASSLINLGESYQLAGRYKEAESTLLSGLELAREIGAQPNIQTAHMQLCTLYQATNKPEQALQHLLAYTTIHEEIQNSQTALQIANLQNRYDRAENQRKLKSYELKQAQDALLLEEKKVELANSKTLTYALLVGIAALILVGFLFFRQLKLKQLQAEQHATLARQELQLKAIIQGEERERKRLASELHDGLGQMLSSIKLNISGVRHQAQAEAPAAAEDLNNSLEMIDEAVSELRNISHNLMPGALLQLGLVSALEELTSKINRADQLQVKLHTYGMDSRLEAAREVALYRIIQELINNVLKYAQAGQVTVQLLKEGNDINIMVEDNGIGFDTTTIHKSEGIGWQNIFSRVAFLGGTIEVDSNPGHGTTVIIDMPASQGQVA